MKNYYLADVKWKFKGIPHKNTISAFGDSLESLLEEAIKQYGFADEFTVCNISETRHLEFEPKYICGGIRVL